MLARIIQQVHYFLLGWELTSPHPSAPAYSCAELTFLPGSRWSPGAWHSGRWQSPSAPPHCRVSLQKPHGSPLCPGLSFEGSVGCHSENISMFLEWYAICLVEKLHFRGHHLKRSLFIFQHICCLSLTLTCLTLGFHSPICSIFPTSSW